MTADAFDALIIGTGQSGKPLAVALGKAGWKTAVIERNHVGGTCINYGCTPTKTMVASARVAYLARRGADYGVLTGGEVRVELAEVLRRKRAVVDQFRASGERALGSTPNVELVYGEATFVDAKKTVRVALTSGGERLFTAPRIVINTGGRPSVPPIPGLADVRFLDSTSIMELDATPPHLVVLGGGYIGLEFAQMFCRFGARVTVLNRDERLIPREDPDVSAEVEKILGEDGVAILNRASTKRVEGRGAVRVETPTGERTIEGSHLLVAVGRTPNTDRLNLAAAGLVADKAGYVPVNNRLETAVPGIYAIGDVKGGPAFTHISYDDYRILRTNWLEGGDAKTDGRLVPNTMFIDPQLATVGLNETEAARRGIAYKVAKMPMTYVARAIEMDETRGFMKAIVDPRTEEILGCTILGIEGGELMSMIEIAMLGKVRYSVLREAIFAHPTLAESFNNLFGTVQ